jgi:hypothetical protein
VRERRLRRRELIAGGTGPFEGPEEKERKQKLREFFGGFSSLTASAAE